MNQEEDKTIVMKITPKTLNELNALSRQLNTSPSGVLSQALFLFKAVQGRKAILKQKNNPIQLEFRKYIDQPVLYNK